MSIRKIIGKAIHETIEEDEQRQMGILEKNKKKKQYNQILGEIAGKYVLTISASDYVKSIGKELSDYEFESVADKSLERIVVKGEKIGAEIIVDVKPAFESYFDVANLYLIGTGLIPKEKP